MCFAVFVVVVVEDFVIIIIAYFSSVSHFKMKFILMRLLLFIHLLCRQLSLDKLMGQAKANLLCHELQVSFLNFNIIDQRSLIKYYFNLRN